MKGKKVSSKRIKSVKVSLNKQTKSSKFFYNSKVLIYSLLLFIGLLITVVALQQQQISTDYAQTNPTLIPPTVTPTFGCLGTSCAGTIMPTGVTSAPTAIPPTTAPMITLPANPNGKTPPGFFVSLIHRISNWFSKFVRFGGNPPGNPNIPGTGINPVSSSSGNTNVITIGAGRGKNNATIIYPTSANKNPSGSSSGTVISPTPQPNALQSLINFINQLMSGNNTPKK